MQHRNRPGLQSRLIRVFAVQATLVSVATILGVYAAYRIAEGYLVREALAGEAEHYWTLRDAGGIYPLPDTRNMTGYLVPLVSAQGSRRVPDPQAPGETPPAYPVLPDELRSLPTDYYGRVALQGRHPLVLVSDHGNDRLYLAFKEEQVSRLAFFFGVAPLTAVLLLIYLASWFTFRQSQRLISPVTQLARIVDQADVQQRVDITPQLTSFAGRDADVDALVSALSHYADRIQQFLERERSFTRDAAHELRTPLAVLRGSLDILQMQTSLTTQQGRVLERMRGTVTAMEGLIETLLLLAREESREPDSEPVSLSRLGATVVQQVRDALSGPESAIDLKIEGDATVQASEKVLVILLTNLLRNAVQYGEGRPIEVRLSRRALSVVDQGRGMDARELENAFRPFYRGRADGVGHGLGLAIVRRLCDRYGWKIQVRSAPGKGTSITIEFAG